MGEGEDGGGAGKGEKEVLMCCGGGHGEVVFDLEKQHRNIR